ncbi:MAG: hypothetical protein HY231_00090 [Acidobacteria bacterium]|nr:hypothetical protein [Acidobacteriota bacterium]
MAIHSRNQLENTQKKIFALELALEEMKQEESPKAYADLPQGFIAQIEQMRSEIDEHLGIKIEPTEEYEVVLK